MDPEAPGTSHSSLANNDNTAIYMDNCMGALAEVPSAFDLGTLKVKLCSISQSRSFISIGSECGALFLYNKRTKRALKPLRTTFNEVVTCQKWHERNGDEFLAVGHRSGNLIVLALPSTRLDGSKRLQQTIQEELHKHCPITALEWSSCGQWLYSADASGQIMQLGVDFQNDKFAARFIRLSTSAVRFLAANQVLIACETRSFDLIRIGEDTAQRTKREEMANKVTGMRVVEHTLWLMMTDGNFVEYDLDTAATRLFNVGERLIESELLPAVHITGELRECVPTSWLASDWKYAATRFFDHGRCLQFSQQKIQLVDLLSPETPVQLFLLDIGAQLQHIKDIEVIDADFDVQNEQAFVLTNSQHLIRIGFTPADQDLVRAHGSTSSIFSTLQSAAQKSSLKWFQKFARAGEFQQISPPVSMPDLSRLIGMEEKRQRLAANLNNVLGSIEKTAQQLVAPDVQLVPDDMILGMQQESDAKPPSESEEVTEDSEWETDPAQTQKPVVEHTVNIEPKWKSNADTTANSGPTTTAVCAGPVANTADVHKQNSICNGVEGRRETVEDGILAEVKNEKREEWKEVEEIPFDENASTSQIDDDSVIGRPLSEPHVTVVRKAKLPANTVEVHQPSELHEVDEKASDDAGELDEDPLRLQQLDNILSGLSVDKAATSTSPIQLPTWTPNDHGYGDVFIEETANENLSIENVESKSVAHSEHDQSDECAAEIEDDADEPPIDEAENDELCQPTGQRATLRFNEAGEPFEEVGESDQEDQREAVGLNQLDSSSMVSGSDFMTPSTSSTTGSSVVLAQESMNAEYSLITRLANQRTDVWSRIVLPFTAAKFDVNQHYIVVCSAKRRQKPHYRLFEALDNALMGGEWTQTDYKASLVATNDAGSLLWRVDQGVAYAPAAVERRSPATAATWTAQSAGEGRPHALCLTPSAAWYLTERGPFVQMRLPELGILYRADCPFELGQIAASAHAVWALRARVGTLVVRVGLKHCPMGVDWVEDCLAGPNQFVSVALYETTGFGLDANGDLWICHGVDESRPFGIGKWYQVCSPTNLMPASQTKHFAPTSKWRLKVSGAGVFINVGKYVLSARQPLTAHHLANAIPKKMAIHDCFGLIAASGFVGESNDFVFVGQPNSEIYALSARRRHLTSLPPICSADAIAIISMTAAKDCLYVLDSLGRVHVRDGINAVVNPRGNRWTLLDCSGLSMPIISFAASLASLWAVTADHRLWRSPTARGPWTAVPAPLGTDNLEQLDQVRCSPAGHYVWAMSLATYRAWAAYDRPGLVGGGVAGAPARVSWSETCADIRLADLAVADNAVYGLEAGNHRLHRLRALSTANPAGLYWKSMPLRASALSVDAFDQRLWALDLNNRLVRHEIQIFPKSCLKTSQSQPQPSISRAEPRPQPILFDVQGDADPDRIESSSLSSDWFDAERDVHDS